jgi:hypothetical protein
MTTGDPMGKPSRYMGALLWLIFSSWHPHSHGFQFRSNGDDGLMSMDMEQGEEMDDEDFDDNEEDEVDDFL